jgi:hypothetical protein
MVRACCQVMRDVLSQPAGAGNRYFHHRGLLVRRKVETKRA